MVSSRPKGVPEALNKGNYTYLYDGTYNSRAECRVAFERSSLRHFMSKYRIVKGKGDRKYHLYIF